MDQKYLQSTKMLNYNCCEIQSLISQRKWKELDEYNRIGQIYDFVQNEILFGYNRSDLLTAREVLEDGYGQCNTKATLLMALLRGVGIPCRIHGTEVRKHFQKGIMTPLIAALASDTIVHTWAEVYCKGRWIALEGVITDQAYVDAVKKKCGNPEGAFAQYAIATSDLSALDVAWKGTDTYVQRDALVKDYGTFESPDVFFAAHPQKWGKLTDFAYVHIGRKIMTGNVARIRAGKW